MVLASLMEEFSGKVDLIYIDPPFATGADFSFRTVLGEESISQESSIIEEKAYRDTWGEGLGSFIAMLYQRFTLMRELLSYSGVAYIHIGWEVSHYAKLILDEIFGRDGLLNQVIWKRQTAHSDTGQGAQHLGRIHDVVFIYTKGREYTWNKQYSPYDIKYLESHYQGIEPATGRRYELDNITAPGGAAKGNPLYEFLGITRYWRYSKDRMQELYKAGRIVQPSLGAVPRYKRYLDEMPGLPLQDLWTDINAINSQGREATGYSTQKPETLLDRIIKSATKEGDLVLDLFGG